MEYMRRDHSIIACLRHFHVSAMFVVNRTFNAAPTERLQQVFPEK